MTLPQLRSAYQSGNSTPRAAIADLLQHLRADADQAIFPTCSPMWKPSLT